MTRKRWALAALVTGLVMTQEGPRQAAGQAETIDEMAAELAQQAHEMYQDSPFSVLSTDYFARFHRDWEARPADGETQIDRGWTIVLAENAEPLSQLMASHLADFLEQRMDLPLTFDRASPARLKRQVSGSIVLLDEGGGTADAAESFTITVTDDQIIVRGRDPGGLRDGIVKLVDRIGLRQAPILERGEVVYRPRVAVRLGTVPWMGPVRDLVFMGYNAVQVPGGDLYALSTSDQILELKSRQKPGLAEERAKASQEARKYGLKTYARVHTKQKFHKDHAVFEAHPEIRGALTWKEDGEYIMCTQHPLVRRFLTESVQSVFRADPDLDGIVIIVGGEGFYHCFMRPYGVEKGHTNCARCDRIGPDKVVAELCNDLARAVRKINPNGEVVAWPYSAEHVWSSDRAQSGLIELLKPGTAIFTEIEKDEYVTKLHGVRKHIWDYSIDLIGPGERALQQIEACRKAGIPIYMKSEPELGFEAPRLPQIPCLDRWIERADVLATCGADGAWVFPAFRPCYGTTAAEVYKFMWWDPVPDKEKVLNRLARRVAGDEAGPHLRRAWYHVSEAIPWSPELPTYYTGPYYLGPVHPMIADPEAEVPEMFYGSYLFWAEIDNAEGRKKRPTFVTSPTGNVKIFGEFYRNMEFELRRAVEQIEKASPLVDDERRLMFRAEESPIRWFYHTARTQANFYASCQLRDELLGLANKAPLGEEEKARARELYQRWHKVLLDEQGNARAAIPVMAGDIRLNFKYGFDHSFEDGMVMLEAKLELIEHEIETFLPSVARRCGLDPEEIKPER